MVTTRGLSDGGPEQEECAKSGIKLGQIGEDWIADKCDVIALDARCVIPATFPSIHARQRLFTPLLYTYASELFEAPDQHGSVGVWKPNMSSWELKQTNGSSVPCADPGAHTMDCSSPDWQRYYAENAFQLASRYSAYGVLATELPTSDSYSSVHAKGYSRFGNRVDATSSFLSAVHDPSRFMLVVSSIGFEALIGRATLPLDKLHTEPELPGRSWDELNGLFDGAWSEGWIYPYWANGPLSEDFWEIQVEAADRAARFDNVFIASIAYTNADELEYGLASYLMAAHSQGRLVVQPMPKYPGEPIDAGMSLKVMMREYRRYQDYFDAPLGGPLQERHEINVEGGTVWRRKFQNGDVYVNSHDKGSVTVSLTGAVLTVSGQRVSHFTLGPHTGIILHYPTAPAK